MPVEGAGGRAEEELVEFGEDPGGRIGSGDSGGSAALGGRAMLGFWWWRWRWWWCVLLSTQ